MRRSSRRRSPSAGDEELYVATRHPLGFVRVSLTTAVVPASADNGKRETVALSTAYSLLIPGVTNPRLAGFIMSMMSPIARAAIETGSHFERPKTTMLATPTKPAERKITEGGFQIRARAIAQCHGSVQRIGLTRIR